MEQSHSLNHLLLSVTTPCPAAGLLLRSPGGSEGTGAGELATWGPGPAATRSALVASLQRLLPPTLMVPDGRLEQLVEQALDSQVTLPACTRPYLHTD